MTLYLDTRGRSQLGIGICARCGLKFPIVDLRADINFPGLMVCEKDADDLDPYRLAPRAPEDITLTHPRPDDPIVTTTVAPGDPGWPITA